MVSSPCGAGTGRAVRIRGFGFSTGIALQIITGVLKDATGCRPQGHNKIHQLGDWLWHVGHWQLAATLTALATIALWALARAVKRLEPVALVALAQAAGIAPSMPNPDGTRSDVNGDFRSQGYANLVGGLFQALPSGGSMSRTGVAVSAGARTRQARLVALVPKSDGRWETAPPPATLAPGEVTVLDYAGSSFFAELPRIETQLPSPGSVHGAALVLVVRALPDVPSSAMLKLLDRYAQRLADRGSHLILCGVQPPLLRLLKRSGIADRFGEDGIVPATQELFGGLDRALATARSRISAEQDRLPR
ncbi:SulP family inorganic anion transporter [Streptomyces anulatus]|uniref:SulP family inorganic anion transporter n=1 Tax=Streptomyces anulatus TaxID=1892 RepID=UPI00343FAA76